MTSECSDFRILDFKTSKFWDSMIFGFKGARMLGSYNSISLGFHNLGFWLLERLKNWNFKGLRALTIENKVILKRRQKKKCLLKLCYYNKDRYLKDQ